MTQEYKSFSPEEFRLHNEKLQAEMEKQDIDMLMLSTPENIYYSTGYRSWYTSSLFRPVYVLVPRKGDPAIILRILEKTTVQYTSWTSRIYCWGTASRNLGPLEGEEPISIIDRIIRNPAGYRDHWPGGRRRHAVLLVHGAVEENHGFPAGHPFHGWLPGHTESQDGENTMGN